MSRNFEELDFQHTPIGDISLRRQRLLMFGGREIYEVKLGEDYLMSSLFHEVEVALARIGLAAVDEPAPDVVVGGLGLGYTAVAALEHAHVRSLVVIEALAPVIRWHQQGLVPLGPKLTGDARCRLVERDFFAAAGDASAGFDPEQPGRRFHAILLDIDHSPRHLLMPANAALYEVEGLRALSQHLHPGGVFALWSDDPPDERFLHDLRQVFASARAEVVSFANPFLDHDSASTVYVAQLAQPTAATS